MSRPTATSPTTSPSHSSLHNFHVNVKMFGATGDGITDDTAAIQAAIDSAVQTSPGSHQVYFPPGNYKVTSALTVNDGPVRLTGSNAGNVDRPLEMGARIFGNVATSIIERTNTVDTQSIILDDLTIENTNNAGTCVTMGGLESPAGMYRCYIRGHKGFVQDANVFQVAIHDCRFQTGGTTFVGSCAIHTSGHSHIVNIDIAGFEQGIFAEGPSSYIAGGRIETCQWGVYLGGVGGSFKGHITSINFEACDIAFYVSTAGPALVSGIMILGSVGAPSGSSDEGILVDQTFGLTFIGCQTNGVFTIAPIRVPAAAQRHDLTFIGCSTNGTPWVVTEDKDLTIINCTDVTEITRTGVVATGSLPAAATAEDGRLVIEDNGAGDRNLILYAGGQRFRIDGGAAF